MDAITTKYLGPTNYRGARIVATRGDRHDLSYRRITINYDYALDESYNHLRAAESLLSEYNRTVYADLDHEATIIAHGTIPTGYVFILSFRVKSQQAA